MRAKAPMSHYDPSKRYCSDSDLDNDSSRSEDFDSEEYSEDGQEE